MHEICVECYRKMFFVTWEYVGMTIEVSEQEYRCNWCGQYKRVVRRVMVGDEIVDLN